MYKLFEPDHIFLAHGIIALDHGNDSGEPFYSSSISISEEYVDYFTTGNLRKPQFSMDFPAKRLTTQMTWNDLVVEDYTMQQLDELRIWLEHNPKLFNEWGMSKKLKPGYKALFHGAWKIIQPGCVQNRSLDGNLKIHWRNGKKPGKGV